MSGKFAPWCAGPTTAPHRRGGQGQALDPTAKVAAALIKHGHLATITVVNPVNRGPTVVVPAGEVERFGKQYISLFALAKQQGRHFRAVKKELDTAGIEPALDPGKIGATFSRKADFNRK